MYSNFKKKMETKLRLRLEPVWKEENDLKENIILSKKKKIMAGDIFSLLFSNFFRNFCCFLFKFILFCHKKMSYVFYGSI